MERYRAELEGQTRHDEHHPEDHHGAVGLTGCDRLGDIGQVEAAGSAVEHRHAVEQKARGQRAQHEVLDGGLGGPAGVAPQRGQRVERERHKLKPHVGHQQVVRRDHHHLAEQREQRQGVELATVHLPFGDVGAGIEQRDRGGHAGAQLEQPRELVGHIHAVEGVLGGRASLGEHGEERREERDQGQAVDARHRSATAAHHIGDQHHTGHQQQHDLGQGREQVELVHRRLLDLGNRHVLQERRDGSIGGIGHRLGIQTHPEHRGGQNGQHPEFAPVHIGQRSHMLIGHRTEHHALVHPQRVRRAKDQGRGGVP